MIFMVIDMSLIFAVAFALELLFQKFWIRRMHRMRIEQVTKMYGPAWHDKAKMGTPSMGGVVFAPAFLLAAAAAWLLIPEVRENAVYLLQVISYPLLAALVGFLDDWLKYRSHSSEGLKSLQKLALQIIVTLPWALWVSEVSVSLWPGLELPRLVSVPLLLFTGVGFQNAVNVTDGLDGLATGSMLISFAGAFVVAVCLGAAVVTSPFYLLLAAGAGVALGFLWHNANPAQVFMGDAGAHFFAGLLLSLCVCSGFFAMIVPLGFIFGIEIVSVAIQIIAIRGFNRKVFLMSPVHHHFELLGWKEMQVVTRFWIIHAVGMAACMSLLFIAMLLV